MNLNKLKSELKELKQILPTLTDRDERLGCLGKISAREEMILVIEEE